MRRAGLLVAVALLWVAGCDESEPAGEADARPEMGLDAGVGGAALTALEGTIDPLFLGVWGSSPNDVLFAGGTRGNTGGVLARFDGFRVTLESVPVGDTLWWVWGADARHVWACGEGGRILGWRDRAWREESTGLPPTAVLWGMWGASRSDIWAVGGSASAGGPKGVLLRSGGRGTWTRIEHPSLPTDLNLYKVWGTGASDVHIVGEGGVALHYDGFTYRRVETPTTDLIFTVHGRPGGPILAVGGTRTGLVMEYDGVRWDAAPAPEGLPPLNGVYVQPDGSALMSGARGVLVYRDRDGAYTRLDRARDGGFAGDTLHAVWTNPFDGSTWAVGGDFAALAYGTLVTDLRPPPIVDLSAVEPPPEPVRPDGGADLDQGVADAEPTDMGPPDAALPDATPDAVEPELPFARCGDGVLDVLEDCDDGNLNPDDGCDARCRFECGNGRVDGLESCDDGNDVAGDGCDPGCGLECGNGVRGVNEQCDDGNLAPGDGCDPLCRLECGNGAVEPLEECDDGNRFAEDGCDDQCRIECGNGFLEGAEECDDGNREPGDGCTQDCRFPCGDGVLLEPQEACDDGNREDGDGCDSQCQLECGNGVLDPLEECDDGNLASGDGCDIRCLIECGNGRLDPDEECDDGNRASMDGCSETCISECGNLMLDGPEQCDDGNRIDGDGCDADCLIEPLPGPGEPCRGFQCSVPLECYGVAQSAFLPVCMIGCETNDDCAAYDYMGPTCCMAPGPQLIDTYCVPLEFLPRGCGAE